MSRSGVALTLLLAATPLLAHDVRFARLAGGGPRADDCLAAVDVVGVAAAPRARTVVCQDGDTRCDRDGLVNGRCQLWVRVCLNARDASCAARPVVEAAVTPVGGDTDLQILGRTLEGLAMPADTPNTCGALTTLTIPLGKRGNGSARKGRKVVALRAAGADGAVDQDAITFLCKPPPRVRGRDAITFAGIQARIFEKSCAFSGCHGTRDPQAKLTLVGDGVYEGLVDRLATTSTAQFAGKKLVVPGAPETSFLIDKLEGKLGPGEGAPMPLNRTPLRAAQVEAIRKWILAGAPRERAIAGGLGEEDRQPRIPAPAVPAGGYQAHMTPFMLSDRPETQGCQVVQLDNPDDMFVRQWELFMHEGSHHFILRAYRCDPDGDGVSECDAPAFLSRYPSGFAPCEQFGYNWAFVVGAQTPHFLVDYQTAATGVAFKLHRHQPLLLNSHYTNPYSDTMAEVWVNVSPVDGALVRHPARILFEVVANAFIKVPPGTVSDAAHHHACAFASDIFCSLTGEPAPAAEHFALLGVTSHMHKRSRKFVTDLHDGGGAPLTHGTQDMVDRDDGSTHLYVSTEYNDPVSLAFWPPTVVSAGDQLTYGCMHDNGVTTPVRLGCEETPGQPPGHSILEQVTGGRDTYGGAARWCRSDADCAGFGTGRCVPANLVFGELAEDEMCILPGLYYPCRGDAASCLE